MALRTIQAPGVEIKEVDRSDYSNALVGSNVLAFGFASKGQDYVTHEVGSKSVWTTLYGQPESEAERYFYRACMEAIDQGATLHCAKIPYVFDDGVTPGGTPLDEYVVADYKVNVNGAYLSSDPFLSSITKADDSFQKFFLIEPKLSEEYKKSEFVALFKNAFDRYGSDVLEVMTGIGQGQNMAELGIATIAEILDSAVDTDVNRSSDAVRAAVMKSFDDETRDSGMVTEAKNIVFRNISAEVTEEPELDVQEQEAWLVKLGNGLESAQAEAEKVGGVAGEAAKYVVEKLIGAYREILEDAAVRETKPKKKASRKAAPKDGCDCAEGSEGSETPAETPAAAGTEWVIGDVNLMNELIEAILKQIEDLMDNLPVGSHVHRCDVEEFEDIDSGEAIPDPGEIRIFDISRSKYGKAITKKRTDPYYKECLGIMPIITTAANALYCQQLLPTDTDGWEFNLVSRLMTQNMSDAVHEYYSDLKDNRCFVVDESESGIPFGVTGTSESSFSTAFRDSITTRGNAYFPALFFNDDGRIDREHSKEIGIVVFKVYVDANESSRLQYSVLESFVGSVDKEARNPSTHASTFIDTIVNTQSEYIRCYSNVVLPSNRRLYENCDIGFIHNQIGGIMGLYEPQTRKNISYLGITTALDRIFDKNSDLNDITIDIVVDAGVSNIAQFVKKLYDNVPGLYDPCGKDAASLFTLKSTEDSANWRAILNKYDTFCRKTRGDCMYVADCPRPFALVGRKRTVRETKRNTSIDLTIIPLLRYMSGTNSSYGAGYCDWFEEVDDFSGDTYWCPPSIQAMGSYVNCDLNYNYWDAPAGLTRGVVSANDVAFNPNIKQAGNIYQKNWNYAVKYPTEGVILEGQKTFQVRPSAFDRVNVRRLFLRLERYVWTQARYFVYEPNTAVTRQRFYDRIEPYFMNVRALGGIYDYRIICDETVNTPDVIDRNEFRCVIGIKPTKTIEFIMIQFVALRTGGSWDELETV